MNIEDYEDLLMSQANSKNQQNKVSSLCNKMKTENVTQRERERERERESTKRLNVCITTEHTLQEQLPT